MKKKCAIYICFLLTFASCQTGTNELPYLGEPIVKGNSTSYPVIADFSFINQDNQIVNKVTFNNKIYVANFIFLSCPTICPKMTTEMLKVYNAFKNEKKIAFLSHSIDTKNDTVGRLKKYAETIGVSSDQWHFVTGNQDSIIHLAESSYYATAYPDSTAPGGFTHSGALLLIDKDKHIRGVYNGADAKETIRLIKDIKTLLK